MSTTSFCPVAFLKPLFSWDADTEPDARLGDRGHRQRERDGGCDEERAHRSMVASGTDGTVSRAGHGHGGARMGLQACRGSYSTRSVVRLLIVLSKTTIPKRLILNG